MIQLEPPPEDLGMWPMLAAFNATLFGLGAWLVLIHML